MEDRKTWRIPYGVMRHPLLWSALPGGFGFSDAYLALDGVKIIAYHPSGGKSECWVRYDRNRAKYFAHDVWCGTSYHDVEIPRKFVFVTDP